MSKNGMVESQKPIRAVALLLVANPQSKIKQLLRKIDKLVVGLIVIVLAALLFANGIITVVEPSSQLFGQDAVNLMWH